MSRTVPYVITLALILGMFWALGWQGWLGFILGGLLMQTAHRVRYGFWFDWD